VPSVIYAPTVRSIIAEGVVSGIVHVTGGGIPGNVPRILNDAVDARIDPSTWEPPRVFGELQQIGTVAHDEMFRVFNMGIGMILAVHPDGVDPALAIARSAGHDAVVIGDIVAGSGSVQLIGPLAS